MGFHISNIVIKHYNYITFGDGSIYNQLSKQCKRVRQPPSTSGQVANNGCNNHDNPRE